MLFWNEILDETSSFGPSGMLSSGSGITTQNIDSSNFLGTSLQQNEINVSDEVKDMWEPAHTEPGIPPLLTMPGVHSPNDLVIKILLCIYSNCFCQLKLN